MYLPASLWTDISMPFWYLGLLFAHSQQHAPHDTQYDQSFHPTQKKKLRLKYSMNERITISQQKSPI